MSRPALSGGSQGTYGVGWPHATCLLPGRRWTDRDSLPFPFPSFHNRVCNCSCVTRGGMWWQCCAVLGIALGWQPCVLLAFQRRAGCCHSVANQSTFNWFSFGIVLGRRPASFGVPAPAGGGHCYGMQGVLVLCSGDCLHLDGNSASSRRSSAAQGAATILAKHSVTKV